MSILGPLGRRLIRRVSGTEHMPKNPPVIFAANHVGFFDAPALATLLYQQYHRTIHFLTYDLMWRVWGGPLATHTMGMVRLHPSDPRGSLATMIEKVQAGHVAGIFPEGGRNHHPEKLMPGKTGAVRMALATGAPLIPVGITNTTGWSAKEAFASLIRNTGHIDIRFGPPVDFSAYADRPIDRELLHAATRHLMQQISNAAGVPPAHQS